jgi:hypothetical protein
MRPSLRERPARNPSRGNPGRPAHCPGPLPRPPVPALTGARQGAIGVLAKLRSERSRESSAVEAAPFLSMAPHAPAPLPGAPAGACALHTSFMIAAAARSAAGRGWASTPGRGPCAWSLAMTSAALPIRGAEVPVRSAACLFPQGAGPWSRRRLPPWSRSRCLERADCEGGRRGGPGCVAPPATGHHQHPEAALPACGSGSRGRPSALPFLGLMPG